MKEIPLPSGAKLSIGDIAFAEAKGLYQSILKEIKSVNFDVNNYPSMLRDFVCLGFSSKEVEAALNVCMSRCLYNGLKIDSNTFEPSAAREDYTKVCIEVMENAIRPFMKGLSVELGRLSGLITGSQT